MSFIPVRKPHIVKPDYAEIDWNNPITNGLKAAWLFNEGAGVTVRDLTGKTGDATLDSGLTWGTGPSGREVQNWDYTTSRKAAVSGFNGILGGNPRSFICSAESTGGTLSSITHSLEGYGHPTNNYERWNFRINDSVGNGTVGALRIEFNGGYIVASTDVYPARFIGGYSFPKGGNLNDATIYVNGIPETLSGDSGANAVNTTSSATYWIGGMDTGTDRFWTGNYHFAYLWERELSAAEHLAIANNPYQILRPKTDFIDIASGAAATNYYKPLLLTGVG